MIPFPGESIGLDFAFGAPDLYNSLRLRGGRVGAPATQTLSTGDEWRFWVYDESQELLEEDDADVAVSWVVEVAGGSGTVTASWGFDPTYGDSGAATPNALGTHAVAAGTLVLPTTITAADVISGGTSMTLRLEGISGAVEVQQVKLRVWPSAGVAGGWSETHPGFSTTPTLPNIDGAFVGRSTVTGPTTGYEDAWDGAMTALASGASTGGAGPHALTPFTVGTDFAGSVAWRRASPSTDPFIDVSTSIDGEAATVSGTPYGFIAVLAGIDPAVQYPVASSLSYGVDYITPPTEISADTAYLVQSDGTPTAGWVNPVATVTLLGGGPAPLDAGPSVASEATDTDPIVAGEILRDQVEDAAAVTQEATDTVGAVTLNSGGRWVIVYGSHSMASLVPAFPGLAPFSGDTGWVFVYDVAFGAGTPGPEFAPMKSYANMPSYRVWSPTAVVATLSVVRHGVRNDGRRSTAPRRWGQESSRQSGRGGGYQ